VLEITERTYVVYPDLFREVLQRFREQGFHIAVDDVGTGYSSLGSLADIEPDYLKFDPVFVRGIDSHPTKQDLLDALLSFARKMNTKVIAEGIRALRAGYCARASSDGIPSVSPPIGTSPASGH
jgi:EAL domain-containing protein (putative c-di-GMP-specific phosphodiesterase class I)